MTTYAIISVGGKQYRVHPGQRLLVDRLPTEEGKTFSPAVLLVGGDGGPQLSPSGITVTARVVGQERGPKIRIGKYKKRTGYRRHTGFRAALTSIEIESIGGEKAKKTEKTEKKAEKAEKAAPKAGAAVTAESDAPERPKGMPSGYEDLTVAEIKEAAGSWRRPMLEAALEYELANAKRKGAIAALESALAEKEEG
jgi:large subunit ribosomal protein L21